jgi:hypothetical protein
MANGFGKEEYWDFENNYIGTYEGNFKNWKRHGKGKYTTKDLVVIEGTFVENNIVGFGKKIYPNGNIEEGIFGVENQSHITSKNISYKFIPKDGAGIR